MLRRKHSAFGVLAFPHWVNQEWLFHFHSTTYCVAGCLLKFYWPGNPEVSLHHCCNKGKDPEQGKSPVKLFATKLKEMGAPLLKVILPAVILRSPMYLLLLTITLCYFILFSLSWESIHVRVQSNKWIYLEIFSGCLVSSTMYWWLFLNNMCLNFDRQLFQVSLVSLLNPPFGMWLKHQSFLRPLTD